MVSASLRRCHCVEIETRPAAMIFYGLQVEAE